jgi:hypothetical protein
MQVPKDGVRQSVIYECDIAEVIARTKFPYNFLMHIQYFSEYYRIMVSIRMQHPDEPSNRRTSEDGESTKPSAASAKTALYEYIAHGKVPRETGIMRWPFNPEDNKLPGTFPPGAQDVDANSPIAKALAKYEQDVIEIKKYGKRICYSAIANVIDNNGNLIKQTTKHYIQEAETLAAILYKIDVAKTYTFKKIEHGKIYIEYEGGNNKNYNIIINLNDIYPPQNAEALASNPFKNINKLEDFRNLVFPSKDNQTNNLQDFHAPLFFQKEHDDDKSYVPLMVSTGDNGHHMTSDADFCHLGMPCNLPQSADFCFQSKTMSIDEYLGKIKQFIQELKAMQYNNSTEEKSSSTEEYAHVLNEDFFINAGEEALDYFKNHTQDLELYTVGASSVYSLIMQYKFNYDKNNPNPMLRRGDKESIWWWHGAEEIHPGAQPELFKGTLVCWKGKFFLTSDEKSYLDFLFSDPDILRIQKIGVHPYWLRDRSEEEKVYGIDLSEYWLDFIKIQALNRKLVDGTQGCNHFFNNLIYQITTLKRKNNANEIAVAKICEIQKQVNNIWSIQNAINETYEKYKDVQIKTISLRSDDNPYQNHHRGRS